MKLYGAEVFDLIDVFATLASRRLEQLELATLGWIGWFNNCRLLEPFGNIPPAEAEVRYFAHLKERVMVA